MQIILQPSFLLDTNRFANGPQEETSPCLSAAELQDTGFPFATCARIDAQTGHDAPYSRPLPEQLET
jgi:hypothetical protein